MNLITNRTSQDVERWRVLRNKGWGSMTPSERQEWLGEVVPTPSASRGMYTHNDLNRVESAVAEIVGRMRERGCDVSDIVVKTNWTYRDPFTEEDATRYLGNISKLRSFFPMYPTTPLVPSVIEKINFRSANDIEKILVDVSEIFTNLSNSHYYSGELFAGEA